MKKSIVKSKVKKEKRFSVALFIYSVLFLSENFLAAADNRFGWLVIVRFAVYAIGFVYLLTPKISMLNLLLLFFCFWNVMVALWSSTLLEQSTFYLIRYISLGFILDYHIKKRRTLRFVNSYFAACILCMVLNFVINPRELGFFMDVYETSGNLATFYGRTVWFTGSRNTFGEYFMVSTFILLTLAEDSKTKKMAAFAWSIIGISMAIYVWSASTIVVLIMMLSGIVLIDFYKLNIRQSIFLGVILNFSLVILRIQTVFENLIVNILHRNLTFTGRTTIWDFYLERITEHFWFGSGHYQSYINAFGREYTPHNAILSIFETYGFFGFLMICIILIIALRENKKSINFNDRHAKIVGFFFLLFLIRGTFENAYGYIFIYITILSNLTLLNVSDSKNKDNVIE